MSLKRYQRAIIAGCFAAIASLIIAGCGQQGDDNKKSDEKSDKKGPKVGLVTDIGGLNDRSFNYQANQGFERAKKELNATGSVIESKSDSDYPRNLGTEVKNGSEVIFGIGFLMGDAVKSAAAKATDIPFAIIDFSYTGEDGKWGAGDNVVGVIFKEEEAGYLAGVLAGAAEAEGTLKGLNDKKIVSVVGGQKIPPVERYIVGFEAGVKAECKDCEVLIDYSQDFIDQSKCQDRANAQIARGSDIVFQVAGQCGLGALTAAKEKGVWGIGVDADQAHLGDHILTSAMKRIDTAVFEIISSVNDGKFEGGKDLVFGLDEDGVGLGKTSKEADKYMDLVDQATKDIISGKIKVPTV